ncbi:PaaI family thioesterase [Nocardioides malaquae]|nr:PaaI family thioesterase [Nocardioides malaquae]
MSHIPRNPDFDAVVRGSFASQAAMKLVGAALARVEPGEVEIEVPFRRELTQQQGLVHAGFTTTAMDTACGYAALTLMPPGSEVVSVNFNVSLLAPAVGGDLVARGHVVRSGRTITFTEGAAYVRAADGSEMKVATMSATMMRVELA